MKNKYLIDTSVFITAHRQIYPFDIAPSFWQQLVDKVADKIWIIESVQKEIYKGAGDELMNWYNSQSSNFTVSGIPDEYVINAYQKIINSVQENKNYTQKAKSEFASVADSWLCAYALAYGSTIVTMETYDENIKNRVKIPNVCKEFGIKYIDMIGFMRETGIKL